ncbi:MAG: hypothetical protein K8U57_19640 [Planctomycetes bacterium]|nr:hypothetical protein [Planctomycetota bacterium]
MTLEPARTLDTQPVTVSFVVAKPTYTLLGCTMGGDADRDADAELFKFINFSPFPLAVRIDLPF